MWIKSRLLLVLIPLPLPPVYDCSVSWWNRMVMGIPLFDSWCHVNVNWQQHLIVTTMILIHFLWTSSHSRMVMNPSTASHLTSSYLTLSLVSNCKIFNFNSKNHWKHIPKTLTLARLSIVGSDSPANSQSDNRNFGIQDNKGNNLLSKNGYLAKGYSGQSIANTIIERLLTVRVIK